MLQQQLSSMQLLRDPGYSNLVAPPYYHGASTVTVAQKKKDSRFYTGLLSTLTRK